MADSDRYVQVPADGAGKRVFHEPETVDGSAVHVPVVRIADSSDPTLQAPVSATLGVSVDVKASALPSGAATASAQSAGNASLSSIDGKTPALGQALAAASVPVVLTAAQVSTLTPPAAITGFATSAKQDTIIGHVDGLEGLLTTIDADTSVLAAVDYATGADVAALGVTGGGVEASALRVTIANDSTGVVSVDDNGGSLTVDGTVTANAGSGTFAVSAASLPLPSGAATAAKQPALGTAGTASADVITVQGIASMTALKVDGSAVTQPVSGTVSATVSGTVSSTQSGTWTVQPGNTANTTAWKVDASSVAVPVTDNSGSLTVDAPVGTPVFVRLSDGASAITTLPVSLASVPSHAVTNAGTFAVQVDGSALTSLQLIDDPVIADDSAFTPATSKVMMAGFEADESSTDSVDEGDAGAARMTLDRKQIVTVQPHTSGGLSTFMASGSDGSSILVATAQAIKASAGQMYGYYAYNPEAAVTFVHFYNTAAASVTVGTTNPLFTIAIPAGSAANLTIPQGITFSNAGWSCAATTTAGGNTAPATGVSLVVWFS